jgi:hypothetical protein
MSWSPKTLHDSVLTERGRAQASGSAFVPLSGLYPRVKSAVVDHNPNITYIDPLGTLSDDDVKNIKVQCRCGRNEWVWAMVDVSNVDSSIKHFNGNTTIMIGDVGFVGDYVCNGCWSLWFWEGKITKSEFFRQLGAPQSMVDTFASSSHNFLP